MVKLSLFFGTGQLYLEALECAYCNKFIYAALCHRIIEGVWKGQQWVIWSKPPAQAVLPQSTGLCPGSSWILPVGDTPQPLWGIGSVHGRLHVKELLLMFRWNFLWISFCPMSLVLMLRATEQSLAPFSWKPPFRYWQRFMWCLPNHLFFRLNRPRSSIYLCKEDASVFSWPVARHHWKEFPSGIYLFG